MIMDKKEKKQHLERLKEKIEACQRCALYKTRLHVVPGEGNIDADIMFIGEAPGRNEDIQGKPFVGRAGNVFDTLLQVADLTRNDIYLCNILKCRPPGNRNPLDQEIKACVGSLDIQIKVVNPRIIGTLGNFPTTYIFEKFGLPFVKIGAVHGKVFSVQTTFGPKTVIPFYHPAVATYDPRKIDVLLNDFRVLRGLMNGPFERQHFFDKETVH